MLKEIYPESLDGHVSHIYNLERRCWDMQYYPNTTASSSITKRPPLHKLQSLSPGSWTQHDKQHSRHQHPQLMPSQNEMKKQTGRQSLVQEKSKKKTRSLTQRWGHHLVSVHQIHKRSTIGCKVQNWQYLESLDQIKLTKPENVYPILPHDNLMHRTDYTAHPPAPSKKSCTALGKRPQVSSWEPFSKCNLQ